MWPNFETPSPMILVRISDGPYHMHRGFNDLHQALRSGEAFAKAGFDVSVISATGRFLFRVEPKDRRAPD
jgi:hypothetical protein